MQDEITLTEIFYSIQGESTLVGYPTVFVRTTGCNLRCHYCDTDYSYAGGKNHTLDAVEEEIASHGTRHVCITGGEPLLQKSSFDLMRRLCDKNYVVSLETSGSRSIEHVDPRVKTILDVKTPDSGEAKSFLMENLNFATPTTEFKFVICTENDFDWSENFVREHDLASRFSVLYSPSFEEVSEKWLAKKMLSEKSCARLQLQIHKYIWPPNTRGV